MIKINDNINIRGSYRKVVCDVKVKAFILKNSRSFIINHLILFQKDDFFKQQKKTYNVLLIIFTIVTLYISQDINLWVLSG